jgi:hypothetical protein
MVPPSKFHVYVAFGLRVLTSVIVELRPRQTGEVAVMDGTGLQQATWMVHKRESSPQIPFFW